MLIKNLFIWKLQDLPDQAMILFGLKEAGFGVIEIETTDTEMDTGQDQIKDALTQKGIGKDPHEDIIGLRAEDRIRNIFKIKKGWLKKSLISNKK
jgi:hypothetical protein